MCEKPLCSLGNRSEKIKRNGKIHCIKRVPEINYLVGSINNCSKKDELFSVPKGPFKIFPRAYYKCVKTDDGNLVCFK